MTKPILFLDFDDCVNFFNSRTAYRKNKDGFSYLARVDIHVDGLFYAVNWSKELVRKFNEAKEKYDFSWLWLTSWKKNASDYVDRFLGTNSDGYIDWDCDPKDDSADDANKYTALLATLRANPAPFIWIDDSATDKYNKDDFVGVLDVPHLIIKPVEKYGILKNDLKNMIDFLDSLGNVNA